MTKVRLLRDMQSVCYKKIFGRLCAAARVALILSIQKIGYSIRDVNIEYSSSFCKMVYLASLAVYKAAIYKEYQDSNSGEI